MSLDLHTVLERAAFERYILATRDAQFLTRTNPDVDSRRDYTNALIQSAWEAWLTRAAQVREESADSEMAPSTDAEAADTRAEAPADDYAALRVTMSHATAPGRWVIGDPTGNIFVGVKDSDVRLIEARARGTQAELTGFTELVYAIAAANAVPGLLKDRQRLREGLSRMRGFSNMAAATFREQPVPMSCSEYAGHIMKCVDDLIGPPSVR